MPGISGMEITQHVRENLKSDIPVIILTSSGVEQTELDSFDIGANEFIAKPVSPAVLLVRINKLLKTKI
ncbi:Phosphate regulon transcriptional regulatory protein PhoB [compost metagenome]